VHYPAAFYTALLNNQPMGFYHPATLVKDAQRRGVRFQPIDVQVSQWNCTVEADGSIRLGLRYVSGLRQEIGQRIPQAGGRTGGRSGVALVPADVMNLDPADLAVCPKCGCDDPSMLERSMSSASDTWFCNNCSHDWHPGRRLPARYASLDDLVARTGLRRDEIVKLADTGALNGFGYDRRSALWQAEHAVRPAGELFAPEGGASAESRPGLPDPDASASGRDEPCPLRPMTESERIVADYAGTGLTMGRHPMALRRDDLAARGVMRAGDLRLARQGRRVRVAGMVITRQRPGTAKGFVFLTLEDETGIANIIVRPDLFERERLALLEEPFLIVDGMLQQQDGVVSVRGEAVQGLSGPAVDFEAHDFY
jgi:error-prone DNA polymerase